jgi:hypothetical protein
MANVERAIQRRGLTSDVRARVLGFLTDATCKYCRRRIAPQVPTTGSASGQPTEVYFFHRNCVRAGVLQLRAERLEMFRPAAIAARRTLRQRVNLAKRDK